MPRSETKGWRARIDVIPEIVILRDPEVALVFVAIVVRVSDQRRLPVVVEEGVGNRDEVGGVSELFIIRRHDAVPEGRDTHIDKSIIIVLVVVPIR